MTPLPKRRHSTQRQGKRRASIKLVLKELKKCSNCSSFIKPHIVCKNCGFYNGKDVLSLDLKAKEKEEKRKKKQEQIEKRSS